MSNIDIFQFAIDSDTKYDIKKTMDIFTDLIFMVELRLIEVNETNLLIFIIYT